MLRTYWLGSHQIESLVVNKAPKWRKLLNRKRGNALSQLQSSQVQNGNMAQRAQTASLPSLISTSTFRRPFTLGAPLPQQLGYGVILPVRLLGPPQRVAALPLIRPSVHVSPLVQ
mmetsp:Transcript_16109/g.46457  ORF Transcript_16109/g.46457 Transcript_16109/m.46457 type:complete len:115 (+) Transcript_16109:115-459(+)